MKVSGNVLLAIIILMIAYIVIGPNAMFGINLKGDRYEIPKVVATQPVQQVPQE